MSEPNDPRFMHRAVKEARKGLGRTRTNPLVGACLVHEGELLGAAAHRSFGSPHAEAALLGQLGEVPPGSHLYTTLEPCIHTGKTPPCLDRILGSGVERVIVAHADPHPAVNGDGIRALRAGGLEVEVGVGRGPYRWLNRAYFYRQSQALPWVELKLAMSADGYIALPGGESRWITGEESRSRGHRLRSQVDAVLVGASTLRADDPRLTDRITGKETQPRAVVVTRRPESLPLEAHLLTERANSTWLLVPPDASHETLRTLRDRGVSVLRVDRDGEWLSWRQALSRLTRRGVGRILAEGGGKLAGTLLDAGVVNELHLFYSGTLFGEGVPSVQLSRPAESVPEAPASSLIDHRVYDQDVYVRRLLTEPLEGAGMSDCVELAKEQLG